MVAMVSQYGCLQRSRVVSHIASGFPHNVIMCLQHITMFLDSIIAASWRLLVCCYGESMGRVLELLVMIYTDNLKGA